MGAMISELTTDKLLQHAYHHVVIVKYGNDKTDVNVSFECEDCNEVLADGDIA